MTNYGPYVAFDVEFDTGGHFVDPFEQSEALKYLTGDGAGAAVPDVFVISHGWNNDIAEARDLYHRFFDSFARVAATTPRIPTPKDCAVIGIFWPSKKFADASLIPGGTAAFGDPLDMQLNAQLDMFKSMFADNPNAGQAVDSARRLIPTLSVNPIAQDEYVQLLSSLVPKPRYEPDEGLDTAIATVANLQGRTVLKRLSQPVRPVGTTAMAGFDIGEGIKAGAAALGNVFTYYTMKDRAGIVGRTGAVAMVQALRDASPAARKIHLVGHSFGGRLVTALANSLAPTYYVDSMTLLEAAYSHNGMATNWDGTGSNGSFQGVLANRAVQGPILITHSVHDIPVGIMYPTASRLMNQVAASVYGGPDDKYGGLGRNGAQHTPQVLVDVALQPIVGGAYPPAPPATPWVLNINGDGPNPKISDHGDVCKDEIASAMLTFI